MLVPEKSTKTDQELPLDPDDFKLVGSRLQSELVADGSTLACIQTSVRHFNDYAGVRKVEGDLSEPLEASYSIPPGTFAIGVRAKGAILIEAEGKRFVGGPGHVTVALGPITLKVLLGRGRTYADTFFIKTSQIEGGIRSSIDDGVWDKVPGCYVSNFEHLKHYGYEFHADELDPEVAKLSMVHFRLIGAVLSCKPSDPYACLVREPLTENEALRQIFAKVLAEPERQWRMDDCAEDAGYSTFHFSRVFSEVSGVNFKTFVKMCRVQKAVKMVAETNVTIGNISVDCGFGFGTTYAMREAFMNLLGFTPSEIRAFFKNT